MTNPSSFSMYTEKDRYDKGKLYRNPNILNSLAFPSQQMQASQLWLSQYWRTMFILSQTYNPENEQIKRATKCFYQSLSQIIPSPQLGKAMQDFIDMSPATVSTLFSTKVLTSFFLVHTEAQTQLENNPSNFFNYSLEKGSDALFIWVYLLYAYYHILTGQSIETFNQAKSFYKRSNISKEFWSHSIWFVIHFSACHAPKKLNRDWILAFKAFVCCLLFILPCPVCREHWRDNLATLPIDPYFRNCNTIFEWTVAQHNGVNKMLEKPLLNVKDAFAIYRSDFV